MKRLRSGSGVIAAQDSVDIQILPGIRSDVQVTFDQTPERLLGVATSRELLQVLLTSGGGSGLDGCAPRGIVPARQFLPLSDWYTSERRHDQRPQAEKEGG
jgi:hypothetical protein